MISPDSNLQNLTTKDLRSFGLIMAGMICLVFGLLIPWLWNAGFSIFPWLLGGGFGITALLTADSLGPVYRIWMKIGNVLGWINTRLILGLVFYVIMTPFGLIAGLFRDPLQRKQEPTAKSYRSPSETPDKENLRKPY